MQFRSFLYLYASIIVFTGSLHYLVIAAVGSTSTSNKDVNTNTPSNIDENAIRAKCKDSYGVRSFLHQKPEKAETIVPPLLYSLPGSGNTWSRLLIEYATGIFSGSIYNDIALKKIFPGEMSCNTNVSVVKAHPMDYGFQTLFNNSKIAVHKCAKQGSIQNFNRMILIVRHPLDAIWSEYLRQKRNSHVGQISKKDFNAEHFLKYFREAAKMYERIHRKDYALARTTLKSENFMSLRYEDLRDETLKIDLLTKLVRFLHLESRGVPPETLKDAKRIGCAFFLAEHRDVHRPSITANSTNDSNSSLYVSIIDAYLGSNTSTKAFCSYWPYFHPALQADKYSLNSFSLMGKIFYLRELCPELKLV